MKRLPVRIALVVAATASALGVGEVVVRLLGVAPGFAAIPFGLYVTSADPELLWEPRPGGEGVNSAGLRGAEAAAEKTRPRLLVLGDSIAWGLELADDETIPARLEARLAEAGHAIEVLNAGVSGYGTVQEARRLELLAPRLEPDHVVLLFCVNDADARGGLPEGVVRFARRDDASEALARVHAAGRRSRLQRALMSRSHLYRSIHEALVRRHDVQIDDARPAGQFALDGIAQGLRRIGAVASRHGFGVTVVTVPVLAELGPDYPHRRLHAEVLALARERGFDALDLEPVAFAALQREPRALSLPGDPLHPNAAGADLFAQAIAERWSQRQARAGGE